MINSVAEYVEEISGISYELKKKKGKNSILLFRGQDDENNVLLPSIGRNSGKLIGDTFLREEGNMIEMAKYKMPHLFNSSFLPVDLLALLQHHGIPTRLLDVSENALVALYFASVGKSDADGEVLVFNHNEHEVINYPIVNAIADSYRFVRGTKTLLKDFYSKVIKQPYYIEHSYFYENDMRISSYDEGAEWIRRCCDNPMIIFAKSYGLRQRIQRGRYILFPNSIETGEDGADYFTQSINPIPKEHSAIIRRFIISKESKERIRADLRLLGISMDMLFMDNEDITCREIADRVKDELI